MTHRGYRNFGAEEWLAPINLMRSDSGKTPVGRGGSSRASGRRRSDAGCAATGTWLASSAGVR